MALKLRLPWSRVDDSAAAVVATDGSESGYRSSGMTVIDTARMIRDGLVNVMAGLGGPGDRTATSHYSIVTPLSHVDLENMYRGSWLPRKIVDCVANDMTREWVSYSWPGHDTDEKGPLAIKEAERRLHVRFLTTMALRWGRLFGGAGLIMGIRGQNLWEPLDLERVRQGDLQWLMVRNRWFLIADGDFIDDPGPMMGYPKYYGIVNTVGGPILERVHHTRVIRFGGDPLPEMSWLANQRWDDSVLQAPYNAIKRYDAANGGIGSLIWDAKTDVIKIDNLKKLLSMKDIGEQELQRRFSVTAMVRSMFNFLILDKNDDYERKQIQFSGLDKVLSELRSDLSGASDIPIMRLFGQSSSGMNSTGDNEIRNFYDKLSGDQESILRPGLAVLLQVLVRSALDKMPDQFDFTFNPLWQMSDAEQATMEKTRAERDQINWNIGAVTTPIIAKTLHLNRTYPPMQDKDIALLEKFEARKLLDPGPEQPAGPGGKVLQFPGGPQRGTNPGDDDTKDDKERDQAVHDAMALDLVREKEDGWHVYNESGDKHLGGPYGSKKKALARLRQVEFFKSHDVEVTDATEIQSIVFSENNFNHDRAEAWLRRNGRRSIPTPSRTADGISYEDETPASFDPESMRSVDLGPGVSAVVGLPLPRKARRRRGKTGV